MGANALFAVTLTPTLSLKQKTNFLIALFFDHKPCLVQHLSDLDLDSIQVSEGVLCNLFEPLRTYCMSNFPINHFQMVATILFHQG